MDTFRFYCPIVVRFSDLDAYGHVNNSRYLTYLEQGRVEYLTHLGLWDGHSVLESGFILADVHIAFREPIRLGQDIRVGVRVTRLGRKSLQVEQNIEESPSGQIKASATVVLVAYDYHILQSVLIPEAWREIVAKFEDIPLKK